MLFVVAGFSLTVPHAHIRQSSLANTLGGVLTFRSVDTSGNKFTFILEVLMAKIGVSYVPQEFIHPD